MRARGSYLFILLGILLILAWILIFINFNVLEEKEYAVKFEVGGTPGFDLNSSALTFGRLPAGSSSTRSVLIQNDYDTRVFVSLFSSKSVSKMLVISENDFFLEPQESKAISFFVYASPNASLGEYNGQVKIRISRYGGLMDGKH